MELRIATYNLNNLFERAKILDINNEEPFSATTREVLGDVARLNTLLEKDSYAGATGEGIKAILKKYFIDEPYKKEKYFTINEIKGKLYSATGGTITLKAAGREDWLGFVEFTKVRTRDAAVVNTARVLDAVDADIVCTVEVDNRLALRNFAELVEREFEKTYKHSMLIDGNDERGIDVGLLSRYSITNICSHVDDEYEGSDGKPYKIFSRDCAEYTVALDEGTEVHLLCNHFKSKGYGSQQTSNARRRRQAGRVAELLERYDLQTDYVVVAGDFNDTPESDPLSPLRSVPFLRDVLDWSGYSGERGTYHSGRQQIDYLLVSQPLFDAINEVGIERRGIFKRGNHSFPEVTSKATQASDHACVWATFDL